MNKMIFIFNIVLIFSSVLLISADYSYKNADDWKNDYPQCGGSKQSPVNIELTDMYFNAYGSGEWLKFLYHDTLPERMILKNDGHTLKGMYKWAADEEKIPYVSGGPLEHEYILHSIQFRWSTDINSGTEHQLAGIRYSMEIQFVYYNRKFDSYEDAEETERGLLIHAIIFSTGPEESEFLTKFTGKISEVSQPGTETEIEPFSSKIIEEKEINPAFLVYDGSLTYPPCTESVLWLIYIEDVFNATTQQLQQFHTLELLNGDDHNNRPLQALNDRRAGLISEALIRFLTF